MSLARAAIRAMVATQRIEFGLARRGDEITTEGYGRALTQAAAWTVRGARATVTVEFGPFVRTAEFDAVVVVIDGDPATTIALPDTNRVSAGGTFIYEATLIASDG